MNASSRGRGPGEVHRADVDVGLAEHQPDPAHRPGPVPVAGDEHGVGRRHVEPVVVEPGDPGLAVGDRPATTVVRPPVSPDTVSSDENAPASGVLRSTTVIPRALARAPALTRLTRSVVDGLEQAAQHRGGQRRAVVLGQLAGDLEGQRADAAARELGEEPPEDLGQRQVRRDRPGRLRGEQRGVDRVARAPAIEHVEDLGGDLLRDQDLRLGGRRAEVRGQDVFGRVEQGRVRSAARVRRRRSRRRRAGRP